MNFRHIGADLKVVARSYTRNPLGLFFSLIFPIILIGLFGLIFSATGSTTVTLEVLNEDHNSPLSVQFLQALNNTTIVKVSVVSDSSVSSGDFASWLGQNDHPVGLIVPSGFQSNLLAQRPENVTLFTNPEDASSAGEAYFADSGVASAFNLHAANGTELIGVPPAKTVGSAIYTYIDFLIPGLIGFSILTSPMFSMVDITSSYRKEGIFRQLSLTPLSRA